MKGNLITVGLFICISFFAERSGSCGNNTKSGLAYAGDSSCSLTPFVKEPENAKKIGPADELGSGVNIHFTTGHEKDLDMIAAAGIKFIRMDFVWQNTERIKGIYDWSAYDELTGNLNKRAVRALFILDYSNTLYEEQVESKDPITGEAQKGIRAPSDPESVAAFAKWAAAAVEHFKESNIIWEIWNEPNITFWRPAPDVAQYNTLALAACKAIRAVVPGSVIIGPATSQVPLKFIEAFLSSGILDYLDAVSVHPYRDYSKSPETAATDYQDVRELIDRYTPVGRKRVPVISSEWGYASATKGVSTETQAKFIVRMQLANLLNGIPVSIWYDWKNDGNEPGNFEHNCGTVTADLKPKPAYIALQTMNRELKGFSLLRRIALKNENDYILLFSKESGVIKIAAWTTDQQHSVILEEEIPGIKGSTVTDWRGNIIQSQSDKNRLVLDLNDHPQYITLPSGM